jgi:hypothetical protein
MTLTTRSRRWLALPVVAAAALTIGALLGNASTGNAAAQATPKNSALPTISGTPTQGEALAASTGTWTGSPTSFAYAWSRCNRQGNQCKAIAGATASTYTVRGADIANTLRVTVAAKNADGSASATSAPTAVVRGATGCPAGTGTMQVADVAAPARLLIGQPSMTPGVVTRSTRTIQLRFQITSCNGRPVQGATLFAPVIPYNQFSGGQGTTGADGTVTVTLNRQTGFPASRRQHLLAVFARATKPGEPLIAGVSTRRLFTFKVSLH